jgi:5-methylcytosine-specific restriction endonuclease McrA
MYEKAHGNVASNMDIDHRRPIVKGGGNSASNLRVLSRHANRSFKRTRTAGMK